VVWYIWESKEYRLYWEFHQILLDGDVPSECIFTIADEE
jgi:hypothetical protein